MGDVFKWVIAGAIGGTIGAAIWAGITYSSGHEIGWIAWGVGVVVGIAVRIAAGDSDGWGPGIVASVIAVLSICGGKYAASHLMTRDALSKVADMIQFDDDQMVKMMVKSIVMENAQSGKAVNWPSGKNWANAEGLADFPPDIVKDVKKLWGSKTPAERQQIIEEAKQDIQAKMNDAAADLRMQGFAASFSPMDILFFILAIMSAFKLGAGVTDGE